MPFFDAEARILTIRYTIAKRVQSQADRRRDKQMKNDQLSYQMPQSVFESKISSLYRTASESPSATKISTADHEELLEQACTAI